MSNLVYHLETGKQTKASQAIVLRSEHQKFFFFFQKGRPDVCFADKVLFFVGRGLDIFEHRLNSIQTKKEQVKAGYGIFVGTAHFSNFSCMFLNPFFFSNLNYNCSNLLDIRNLQEQVKNAFCYQKLF